MWDWLRVISWHQLVEWYQFYLANPFGDERADLRAALSGCAIVNEIKLVTGWLGAKNQPLQVADLMIDTRRKKGGPAEQEDRRNAAEYHRKWMESKAERLARLTTAGKVKVKAKVKAKG